MNSKTYDILKQIAQIWLPLAGTLVFAMTDIWHLAHGAQIVGTITAIDTFLGAGLGYSSRKFSKTGYDGHLVVDQTNPAKDTYTLDINTPLTEIRDKPYIRLAVTPAVPGNNPPSQ